MDDCISCGQKILGTVRTFLIWSIKNLVKFKRCITWNFHVHLIFFCKFPIF
jgi:hypothetical protein